MGRWVTLDVASRLPGLAPAETLRRWIKQGAPSRKRNGRIEVDPVEIVAWVDNRKRQKVARRHRATLDLLDKTRKDP